MKLKINDEVLIHSYKHNGLIYKSWKEGLLIEENEKFLVIGSENVLVTKRDGRTWYTNEPAIMFFYKNNWFNIIAQLKKTGIYFYCNIASPYIIEGNILKYIDYDLDLRVFPNGSFKILDKNEYKYHKKLMKYPEEINLIIKSEMNKLIEKKKNNEYPFNIKLINDYFGKYKNIKNMNKKSKIVENISSKHQK